MEKEKNKKQFILAVSGVKNSGKTTLITKLLPELKKRGLQVAVIKHDGHDFEADVPGTDSWKYAQAGADGTCVFSAKKYMVVKYAPAPSVEELVGAFPEVDVILLEGFKYSEYPKIEVIRKGNSSESVCDPKNLLGIVTDLTKAELDVNGETLDIPLFGSEETERLTDYFLSKMVIDSK
ncbi:molybdopterin-guanine dinucleotide biosynthesis protein B [Jingyaoa shaoxingensis]|uniref:Molybdopterin-guanine dinucleotide biosynthesis protein B n=1 Tax=Jingyaoa shaoxingensis TaxID=2763671 RepID=A0ABR7NAK7_9FIRM|nr:molybdopterin-guanine dinucleotide biosynthesis protein B [Jingyaoa shaoxingensis]MBC8573431.1 molybdopterin-guanine dinucleotide biosynthesis protein B [Jingyaoa shaoxingensis]